MIVYFIYATLFGWMIMILVNYHSHKKYISTHKEKFYDVLDRYHEEPDSIKALDKMAFSFTPELVEKREFAKYLNLGRFKYILLDTSQILLSFLIIFLISFFLEFLPFSTAENTSIDFTQVFVLILLGYVICILDAYSKTLKYEKIIKQWYNNER
ncbi:MAG: hypothetical protein JXR69_01420 [Candidatus Delongbacteria bacterium]|nr:hypothetical protein [Candidatus Delongbacteria bacterium]